MIRNPVFLMLAFAIAAPSGAIAGPRPPKWACRSLYERPAKVAFDLDAFRTKRDAWAARFAAGETPVPLETAATEAKTAEDALAYFEAVSTAVGSRLFRIEEVFASDPKRAGKMVGRIAEIAREGGLFTDRRTVALVGELYSIANSGKVKGWRRILPRSANAAIEARVARELERRTLEDAMRELGIFRDPGEFRKFRNWLGNHAYVQDSVMNVANAALMLHFGGIYTGPTGLSALRWRAVPREWDAIYRAGGLPALKPLFAKRFGTLGKVDYAWRIFARAATVAGAGVALYYVVSDPEEAWGKARAAVLWTGFLLKSTFTDLSPEHMQKYHDATFDCDKARREALQDWKDSYESFEGKPLTPESDPDEWKLLTTQVLDAPCDSFRVQFVDPSAQTDSENHPR